MSLFRKSLIAGFLALGVSFPSFSQTLEERVSKLEQDVKQLMERQNLAPPSSTAHDLKLKIDGVDDKIEVKIWPASDASKAKLVFEGSSGTEINLSAFTSGSEDSMLEANLYNIAGPSGASVKIVMDGKVAKDAQLKGKAWNVGWIASAKFSINAATGDVKLLEVTSK